MVRISASAGACPPLASNFTLMPSLRVTESLGILAHPRRVRDDGARGAGLAAFDVAPAERRGRGLRLAGVDLAEDELFVVEKRVVALGRARARGSRALCRCS